MTLNRAILFIVFWGFLGLKAHCLEAEFEWRPAFTDSDVALVHPSYEPMREDYKKLGIDFDVFFDNYVKEMKGDLEAEQQLEPNSQTRKNYLFTASVGDRSCGFAFFKKLKEDTFFLEFLAVSPEFKRGGIGRRLVYGIRELYPTLKALSLDTRNFNKGGQRFYEAIGFKASGIVQDGYIHYQVDFSKK